jgi:hypothetical protein
VSYELSVEDKGQYLHFKVTGENGFETVRSYLTEIAQRCIEHNISSVLVEENLTGPGLKLLDIFRLAEEGSQKGAHQFRRVAYIDLNQEHSEMNTKFAATVASNRGLNVRIFSTVQEAEDWMRSNGNQDYA